MSTFIWLTGTNGRSLLVNAGAISAAEPVFENDLWVHTDLRMTNGVLYGIAEHLELIAEIIANGSEPEPAAPRTTLLDTLKGARDALQTAITQHIYDESNGEEPDEDCEFTAAVASLDAEIAALEPGAVDQVTEFEAAAKRADKITADIRRQREAEFLADRATADEEPARDGMGNRLDGEAEG